MGAPEHLNSHHRDTVAQIFRHPISHNIEWHLVLSLLDAVGTVHETHKGNFLVTMAGETETFERAPQGHRRRATGEPAPTAPQDRIRPRGGVHVGDRVLAPVVGAAWDERPASDPRLRRGCRRGRLCP